MVSELTLLLAHGADPSPISWDEALANLVKFGVTFLLIAFMSYPVLAPLLADKEPDSASEPEEEPGVTPRGKNEIVGWVGVALVLVLAVGWWLTRASLVEVMAEEPVVEEDHAHTQTVGGQVAMWGDFHAEVVRVESGEVRIYLRDSYNRDIAARFFEAEVQPLVLVGDGGRDESGGAAAKGMEAGRDDNGPNRPPAAVESGDPVETTAALNEAYRFARLPLKFQRYRVKVSTPGWSASLRFDFDGERGRRSLPIWCATPGGP